MLKWTQTYMAVQGTLCNLFHMLIWDFWLITNWPPPPKKKSVCWKICTSVSLLKNAHTLLSFVHEIVTAFQINFLIAMLSFIKKNPCPPPHNLIAMGALRITSPFHVVCKLWITNCQLPFWLNMLLVCLFKYHWVRS